MVPNGSLGSARRELEEAFFLAEDQKLVKKLREMRELKATKEALSKACGIHNEVVLTKLIELGIRAETAATLSLVPVVEVAWADGEIDAKERQAILEGAKKAGVGADHPTYGLIEEWLTLPPKPQLLEAWTHYVEGLCEVMSEAEMAALRAEVVGLARRVAEASGGFLGLTSKVSAAEKKMLAKLEGAFHK
ncbi:MAG: hypothetical protein AB1486_28145 [Planctomycetota bacterium]